MNDRTRSEKTPSQDLVGVLFCLVGGFFAVSIVLVLRGAEPKPGLMGTLTSVVLELVRWLGPAAALVLSLGVAALGTMLFLRPAALAVGRPLAASAVFALGLACLLGAFVAGGSLG